MSLLDQASLILTPNGYKASKLYSVKPTNGDGDMVVSRGTNATRVDSSGFIELMPIDVPRLDYPPLGGCPRILIEPERINRVTYSEQFNLNPTPWITVLTTVTANTTTAPDGNVTADKLIATAVLGEHIILQTPAGSVSGTTVTVSVFAKAAGLTRMVVLNNQGGGGIGNFDLTAGNATLGASGVSVSIQAYPNDWYRCSMTYTPNTTGLFNFHIKPAIGSGTTYTTNFLGNGVDGISIWGAQLETGSTATSYIPTVASVTRNADVISKTGVSSLIGQPNGTIFVEANLTANTEQRRIITIGTELQRIMFWTNATTLYASFNGVAIEIGTFPIGTAKMALGYTIAGGSTTYSIKVNNNTLITGTAAAAPSSLSAINLGNSANGTLQLNDRIESVTLFLTRLTDPQLATLTAI